MRVPMGVGWLDCLAAGWLADMRSKQVPTSTTSARRLARAMRGAGGEALAAGAGGAAGGPEEAPPGPEEEEPLGPGGPYACSQCRGNYPTRDQLERHETLHSPSTQTCKICHKSFANVYRLQRHMISHDESALLRKFKCNDCDKAFKFKHHLKEHLRIHSGEKPFECANCGKKFSHSGSYSSHMTSKKCLVMNLKMGRIKPTNPALNPDRSPSRKRTSLAQQLNNNLPHNGGAFLPILPKYSDAAAFFASMSQDNGYHRPTLPQPPLHPFYMPPSMAINPDSVVTPYSFPTSLSQLFEQLASSQYQHRKVENLTSPIRTSPISVNPEDMIEEVAEEEDKRSEGSAELVMDIEEEEAGVLKKEREERETDLRSPSCNYNSISLNNNGPEVENNHSTFNTILESVSASVTKHFFRANMQKLSPVSGNICPRIESPPSPHVVVKDDPDECHTCTKCEATFSNKSDLLDHEKLLCASLFRKHEGLAAQVAETVALNRLEAEMRASIQSGASEDEDYIKDERDDKMSLHDTDRKIRVRTALSEEQQTVLKEHYAINPRPNREEFRKIAQLIGLDNRVVQVWFQNNRARERRMAQSAVASDQPLDLSTKRSEPSVSSSPAPSPSCSHSDSDEAVNLSHKSSRSPTPHRPPYPHPYPHSNCSSSSFTDFRLSPSPGEPGSGVGGPKRLLAHKYPTSPLLPMEKLLHYSELCRRSPPGGARADAGSPPWATDDDDAPSGKRLKPPPDHDGQFVCDQCDKTFVKQSSLARHKYEHSGQRPYKCVECPKAFKHKHHLTEHKRLHTGEKPFQCCKCLKKFSHSGSYSQHMNHRFAICKPYRD